MRMFSFYLFSFICLSGITRSRGGPVCDVLSKLVNCPNKRMLLDVTKINVYFYDFQKGETKVFPINEAAEGILSIKKFDKNKKFYVFVHGFATYINQTTANLVRKTFATVPNSYLIIFDHSAYTNNTNFDCTLKSYKKSVKHVYSIGERLAKMLGALYVGGISAKNIHAIGHSLGSQILGYVGEQFTKDTGHNISRITALDPAGPCFSKSDKKDQIRAGVADYVEVYHCDDGGLGTSSVLGDIDFYVNQGKAQPQCLFPPISYQCSHNTCVSMWMASVAHRQWFPAKQCNEFKLFKQGKCSNNGDTNAGFWNPGTAKGVYYFSTKGYKF